MNSRLALLAMMVMATACEPEGLRSTRPAPGGYVLDAGVRIGADAGTATADGGPWDIDAGPWDIDAGPWAPDASRPVDAGSEPACVCPELPAVCTPPKEDVPLFTHEEDAQQELIAMISCAEQSIHGALYEVDWSCISDALYARLVRAPDLTVSLVIDDDQCPRDSEGKLTCALRDLEADPRVTIVDDSRSGYMHHKFWVVDGTRVWTGSTNMTKNSFCTEFNDAWVLTDPVLISAYEARFVTLFEEGIFGPTARVPATRVGPYTLHFGPQSPQAEAPSWHVALLKSITEAQVSLEFSVFALTRMDVALALIQAHQRGVAVRGVVHHRYASEDAALALATAGVQMKKGGVHSKLLIVDTATVATGTANWSSNAWTNNEDSLWIHDPGVAEVYLREFDLVFGESESL